MGDPMEVASASDGEEGSSIPFRDARAPNRVCHRDHRDRRDRRDRDDLVRTSGNFPCLITSTISSMTSPASPTASSMITTLLNTASSPISPGPSSPSLRLAKSTGFVPPERPSSTPFPHPENRSSTVCCVDDSEYSFDADVSLESSLPPMDDSAVRASPAALFDELPTEVHEAILDHLFGYCVSPTSSSAMRISSLTRSWGTALRHSRRKELTQLALVNHIWSTLVQQRLYRHIKLKATVDSIEDAILHLAEREHLASYVKHVEIWFPVFQPTYTSLALSSTLALPTVTTDGLTNTTYTLPGNNCTLEEVFRFVSLALPQAKVMTLEGGERRKAPQVVHFHDGNSLPAEQRALRMVESVQTLVTKGQWNLMRDDRDFDTILSALPNLEEWQGSYSKPKSKSYITLSSFLPNLPSHITNLSLCLENDYRREGVVSPFYSKVMQKTHICANMAETLPALEHFAYTGRVCHKFFETAMRLADPLTSRLKSIDLTVKNCCRSTQSAHDFHESGSGIQDMSFIEAFEKLVLTGVRSLEKFERLQHLRIRFVDLDSVLPPLNPFFLLRNNKCSGIWSDQLVTEMARVRPEAGFTELSDTFGDIVYSKEGRMVIAPEYPKTRITSLKLSNYRSLATRITIQ